MLLGIYKNDWQLDIDIDFVIFKLVIIINYIVGDDRI